MEYFAKINEAVEEELDVLYQCYCFHELFNVMPEAHHEALRAALRVSWYVLFLGERKRG